MEILEPTTTNNQQKTGKGLKTAIVLLSIVAVALAAVLLYMRMQSMEIITELNTEKDELVGSLQQLRGEYDDLQTDNDTLNAQLDEEKQKVEMMIERLKNTEATNRARIREYEKELGTLRDIMRSYLYQIDSLNTLNIALRAETTTAKAEAQESRERYESLIAATDDLAKQVEKGAMLRARDVTVVAINSKGKDVTRASNTDKLKTCFTLIENNIAERGPRSVFIRVKDPDGVLMTPSQNNIFRVNGEQLIYSAVREIDYQGSDIEMCIFYGGNNEVFPKGAYTVDIYSFGALIGSGQLLLK